LSIIDNLMIRQEEYPEERVSTMNNQHDEPCCLELIRRAIVHRDLLAREAVQQHFNETVLHWLRSHPLNGAAICPADEETFVAQTFERFWQATTRSEQLEFSTPNAVLRHLRVMLYGILLERQRTYSRLRLVTSPDSARQRETYVCQSMDRAKAWELLQRTLPNADERRIAYLLYHCGLKPTEIVRSCPQEFSDIHKVYRLRRNILERLLSIQESW